MQVLVQEFQGKGCVRAPCADDAYEQRGGGRVARVAGGGFVLPVSPGDQKYSSLGCTAVRHHCALPCPRSTGICSSSRGALIHGIGGMPPQNNSAPPPGSQFSSSLSSPILHPATHLPPTHHHTPACGPARLHHLPHPHQYFTQQPSYRPPMIAPARGAPAYTTSHQRLTWPPSCLPSPHDRTCPWPCPLDRPAPGGAYCTQPSRRRGSGACSGGSTIRAVRTRRSSTHCARAPAEMFRLGFLAGIWDFEMV